MTELLRHSPPLRCLHHPQHSTLFASEIEIELIFSRLFAGNKGSWYLVPVSLVSSSPTFQSNLSTLYPGVSIICIKIYGEYGR